MAAKKKVPVGTAWEIESGEVTKPDGTTVTVTGGVFILSTPGEYTSGDQTVVAG